VPGGTGSQTNRVLIAVSNTATITSTSNFTFFSFQAGTGRFEFERTVSRLNEMQSADYLALGHGED